MASSGTGWTQFRMSFGRESVNPATVSLACRPRSWLRTRYNLRPSLAFSELRARLGSPRTGSRRSDSSGFSSPDARLTARSSMGSSHGSFVEPAAQAANPKRQGAQESTCVSATTRNRCARPEVTSSSRRSRRWRFQFQPAVPEQLHHRGIPGEQVPGCTTSSMEAMPPTRCT
jgi:hypothetical protein